MTSPFFFGVLGTQLEDYFMKKKHLIRSGSNPLRHSTGCPRSYRGKHPNIFTYYVPAFWSRVDGVSCSKLLTLKIWMHDLYCLTLLNSNLQVLARYNYIYVEQNTKAFM